MAYIPRLTTTSPTPMRGSVYWYSRYNPFYVNGYGMPNCTCYAYGRYAEIRQQKYQYSDISQAFAPLPRGNAGAWWNALDRTRFQSGQTPKLGSIVCYHKPNSDRGHVGVVEAITTSNGVTTITTSNSGFNSTYFWIDRVKSTNGYLPDWAIPKNYVCQGFIYNDAVEDTDPTTDTLYWHAQNTGSYAYTSDEAQENVELIYKILHSYGWTLSAVCGAVGMVQALSGFNPWRWSNDDVPASTDTNIIQSNAHSYGLFQYTPPSLYIENATAQAYPEYAPHFSDYVGVSNDGTAQLTFLDAFGDYTPTLSYPQTYADYKSTVFTPEECAAIWTYNYERPTNYAVVTQRQQDARFWYDFLIDNYPYKDELPTKHKMPLWMYLLR